MDKQLSKLLTDIDILKTNQAIHQKTITAIIEQIIELDKLLIKLTTVDKPVKP